MLSAIAVRPETYGPQEAYRVLYGNQLTETPKRFSNEGESGRSKTLGWVFVSPDCRRMKACRTYQTLFAISGQNTYYTPNTFYRSDRREEATLRFLNALVVDVDVKGTDNPNMGLCLSDLLERVTSTGLPSPTMIVRTPSGGYHVYFVFDSPRKAYQNAIVTYKKIQLAVVEAIGGDRQAIGAERWFRLPTSEATIYRSEQRVNFTQLLDWMDINFEDVQKNNKSYVKNTLFEHPAVQMLLSGADKGKRDNTCYTLALVYKREGFCAKEAESELQEWNTRLNYPLPARIISQKVYSAYKLGAPLGPTAEWISYLSGVPFSYQVWEGAKKREERKTSHFVEWAKDMTKTLQGLPNHKLTNSQRNLAAVWGMSLSSFQEVIKLLVNNGELIVEVHGRGRGAKTTLQLIQKPDPTIVEEESELAKNIVPDSNTLFLGKVVGGTFLPFWGSLFSSDVLSLVDLPSVLVVCSLFISFYYFESG